MILLQIRMADQDWYAGDVYDDNQYDEDQQQQRQQPPADATAAPAAPAHNSTQPYPPRGRDNGARADSVGGGRNTAAGRGVNRGGSQSQLGRDRVIQRDNYRGGDSAARDWQQWSGKESTRDVKDTLPTRDVPRDGFRADLRADHAGGFREALPPRDFGGRAGFRDAPIARGGGGGDGAFRDDSRDFHAGRDYRAPHNFREPPPSGYRQGAAGPRGDARDHAGYRDQPPAQSQHFRDTRDGPHYREEPPSRDHHAVVGRGRSGDVYDMPGRSFGPVGDTHDDQHFPRNRRGEGAQPYRDSAPAALDHRDHFRDGPNYRDSQSHQHRTASATLVAGPTGFRDQRDYSGYRELHAMPPQHDHRDSSGYRDSVPIRASDAPVRHVRDAPNYRDSQPAVFRDHREHSGYRESQPVPHHKDGHTAAGPADRDRDRLFIPRNRETSDIPAGRQVQDQPPSERNPRNDPSSLQHQPEALHSQSRPHSHHVPVIRDAVSTNQGDHVVPSAAPTPVEQQNRKIEERSLSTTVRDDVLAPNPALGSAAGQTDKIERPRFNQSDGRIYLGRVDWNTTRNDLVKFCEKYVDTVFCVLFPFDLLLKVRRGYRRVHSIR